MHPDRASDFEIVNPRDHIQRLRMSDVSAKKSLSVSMYVTTSQDIIECC